MDVLYTCDNNYVWIMGISAISLFENNKNLKNLNVFLLGENIDYQNKFVLDCIAKKYDRKICVIDVYDLKIPRVLVSERWPLSAFTRLFAGELLPRTIEQVLYLDCDTIIIGNLESLSNICMGDHVICGIKDCIGSFYKKNIGLTGNSIYINAGVLLMDIKKLRKLDIHGLIKNYMERYQKFINYADQDILNGIFSDFIGVLPPQYNVMTIDVTYSYEEIVILRSPTNFYTKQEFCDAINKPMIIHYTTNMRMVRPWFTNTNHPLSEKFLKYKEISPWKDKKLVEMVFLSKEAKIIALINKLPRKIAIRILGLIHSKVKPLFVRMRAK